MRSFPLIARVFPVIVNFAVERMSFELLPAPTSTGPGSMTKFPEIILLVTLVSQDFIFIMAIISHIL
jgi:hypothetical protein